MPQPRLWLDEIRDALTTLGGQATLAHLYEEIERRGVMDFVSNPNWKAAVRRTIEQHASECAGFTGLAEDDVFFAPRAKALACGRLVLMWPTSTLPCPTLLSRLTSN